jgi:hypothetical protein
MDTTPRAGDSDNNLLTKIAASLAGSGGSGSAITLATGDARYVLKVGDSMTGALLFAQPTLTASAPAVSISQVWNNAAVLFTGVKLNVTDTASDAASLLFDFQAGGISKFAADKTGRTYIARHEADNAPIILELRKRGTTGSSTNPVGSGDNIARVDFRGWNGTTFVGGATILAQAAEVFTGSVNGTNLVFSTTAIGATTAAVRATLSSSALNLASGVALQYNAVAAMNPLSVYASGTVYTLTATSAGVDFGTTDPILTVNAIGTYSIRARVKVALNGATFAANRTLTLKLRRTNNTAADLTNSTTTWIVPIVTTITNTLAIIDLPEVLYTTANANDTIQIFADISVLPTAGSISIDEASIVAVRTNP